ncbi:hypothetical protein ACJ41O_013241 [Fusarium nematophilum]
MAKHINLQLGWPSPSLFPNTQLLNSASEVLQSPEKTAASLIYGPDSGYEPLRREIARWLTSAYQPSSLITAGRILVSNGASGNLQNILAKFTEPGYTRRIWMVEPCYFLSCPIFTDAGFHGRLRGVPEDDEGLDINFLRAALKRVEAKPQPDKPVHKASPRYPRLYKHVIYAVPTFSNPSGKTMSLRRRQDLVRLAREFDALVVTDDVYDILRWPLDPDQHESALGVIPPRVVDVDRTLDGGPKCEWGNAISSGSFSKIIAPGIRTGWAEGTPALVRALSTLGSTRSGGCPSQIAASFVSEMLRSGVLENHVAETLIPTYRARSTALLREVEQQLGPLGFTISTGTTYESTLMNGASSHPSAGGGYFTYVSVPPSLGIDTGALAALALEKKNLKFAYGAMMVVEGDHASVERSRDGYGSGIRLCWAWHTEDEIREGISRLAELVREIKASNI